MERVTPEEHSHAAVILEMARQKFPDDGFIIFSEYGGTIDLTSNLASGAETIRALEHAIFCVKEGMELKSVKP
jgi:hypothetical protein